MGLDVLAFPRNLSRALSVCAAGKLELHPSGKLMETVRNLHVPVKEQALYPPTPVSPHEGCFPGSLIRSLKEHGLTCVGPWRAPADRESLRQ